MVQQEFDPYALLAALRAGEDVELIRRSVELVLQALIEAEATGIIGAASYERTDERHPAITVTNAHSPFRARL